MSTAELSRKANDLKNRVRVLKTSTTNGNLTPQQTINLVGLLQETIEVIDQLLNKNSDVAISGAKIVGKNFNKIAQN